MKRLLGEHAPQAARSLEFRTIAFWAVTLVLALGVLVGLLAGSVNTWVGVRPISLTFECVSRATGEPVPEAEVELIHPYDDE